MSLTYHLIMSIFSLFHLLASIKTFGLKKIVSVRDLLFLFIFDFISIRLPGRLNLVRISCCFENTRHLTQTKGGGRHQTEAPPLNVWMKGLIAQSKCFT